MRKKQNTERIVHYADMFAAMGNDARLRIMRLLMSAHPTGMIVGDIQAELGIPKSTLSHHLDKLKNEGLVNVKRNGTFLWYMADIASLQEIMEFLYSECCSRNLVTISGGDAPDASKKGK
jgi:DNA-binding transcriptional ArsR family regulator